MDGALAVRVIQGWVAETGVTCARFAGRGSRDRATSWKGCTATSICSAATGWEPRRCSQGWAADYRVDRLVFKKYPSCGGTQSTTELMLDLVEDEELEADDVERVEIRIVPYLYRLVGHPFEVGSNPKVNAQFSARYCAANALLRKSLDARPLRSRRHQRPRGARAGGADRRGPRRRAGCARTYRGRPAGGVPRTGGSTSGRPISAQDSRGTPCTKEEHLQRFSDCLAFAGDPAFDADERGADHRRRWSAWRTSPMCAAWCP